MYIKTISASYERKVNLGDFSSMTVGASTWADLDEDEDPAESERKLFEFCREQVKAEVLRVVKSKGQQPVSISETEKMLGLEVVSQE